MWIVPLSQVLFGGMALLFSALTVHALLRRDELAAQWLTLSGSFALVFFVATAVRLEMIGVAALAVGAGIVMLPRHEHPPARTIAFDSTATRRRRM